MEKLGGKNMLGKIGVDCDYYRIAREEKIVYLEVAEEKREETAKFFSDNMKFMRRAKVKVSKITREEYNSGCSLAGMPSLGKGIELIILE